MLAHTLLALVIFLATVCWRAPAGWSTRFFTTFAAVMFVAINWWAGSQWALLTSDLARAGRGEPTMAGDIRAHVTKLAGQRALCPANH